jgi:uncharacterized membrane protein YqjE
MDTRADIRPANSEAEHPSSYDTSLGDLLKELSTDISVLVRQEVALAKVEMSEKAQTYARASAMMAVAAILAMLAIGVLTACIVLAIDVALPAWLAALIVGGAYLIIAGILVLVGMARLRRAGKPVPEQTIETIKEDVSWARQRARSAKT